jgi:hypothetical protein
MSPVADPGSAPELGHRPLTPEEIRHLHDRGFLAIESFTWPADLARIREILLGLYARFHRLPPRYTLDLGDVARHSGPPQIAEINWTLELAPALRQTRTFQRCASVAEQLLGGPVGHTGFDHAILKPPHNARPTPWHQDQAYAGEGRSLVSVHFWIPLQEVTVDMGCMQFIPGSHRGPLLPHRRRDGSHSLEAVGVDSSLAVACPLPLGGATAHVPRTLHHTGPNTTDEPRLAWSIEFAPRLKGRPAWRSLLRRRV